MKTKAKEGDRVRVKYSGVPKLVAPAPQPRGRQLVEFTVGSDEIIRGISWGVIGMVPGEKKSLKLDPKDAFGAVRRDLFKEVPRDRFPDDLKLIIGKKLTAIGVNSRRRRKVLVVEIKKETVVIDGNHPLAGKTVEVELQLVGIAVKLPGAGKARRNAKEEE